MKRSEIVLALFMAFFCAVLAIYVWPAFAQTTTCTQVEFPGRLATIDEYTCSYSTAAGDAPGLTATTVKIVAPGKLIMAESAPGAFTAMSVGFDITLTNAHGVDVLNGSGMNVGAAKTFLASAGGSGYSQVTRPVPITDSTLTFAPYGNTNNGASGTFRMWIERLFGSL